ncbi:MAG: chromate transporter [Sphingobacteriaceae bacterium]|nr:chromate transporter [Sphingobacteriaceae bacterium]
MTRIETERERVFLRDVMSLSISAFGGPQAHIAVFHDLLVERRKYLSEQELIELNALCQFLPGPTSTQTITAVGMKLGGPRLAWLTLLIWALPACLLMTMIALLITYFAKEGFELHLLRFVRPIAIGFISVAAYRLTKSLVKTRLEWFILLASIAAVLLLTSAFTFPAVLLAGALLSNFINRQPLEKESYNLKKIRWGNLYLYAAILVGAALIGNLMQNKPVLLFENMYRFGSLVFGGGQVLIPMMFDQLVRVKGFLTADQFLSGYGLAQAIPGPVFSFASFLGAMSFQQAGYASMLMGAVIGGVGIFLPGTLLIFFIYPAWEEMKKIRGVKRALSGVNAAACGLVIAAAILLTKPIGFDAVNLGIVGLTFVALNNFRIPPILLVTLGIIAGVIV